MSDEIDYEKENAEFMKQAWTYKLNGEPLPKYEVFLKQSKHWHESSWSSDNEFPKFPHGELYRWKKETVMHPGGEIPKPLSVEEAKSSKFVYAPNYKTTHEGIIEYYGIVFDSLRCKVALSTIGMAFKSDEDATEAAKVIFAKGVEVND